MPNIKPISDLRNHFNEIEKICNKKQEPVFITKNGHGDLVIMSLALYEKQQSQLDLYQKISEAEQESRKSTKRVSHDDLMKKLSSIVHG